jgi:sigma-B regulation protein RsbU (phosphoserine phosphatase)
MAYGIYDSRTHMVSLVRAGYPFPALLSATGRLRLLKPEGFAVGLFPGPDIVTEEFLLEKGDRLFFYSDGLVESTNGEGDGFGVSRLTDLLMETRGVTLAEQRERVRQAVVAWRGSESFADDVSLLALERE